MASMTTAEANALATKVSTDFPYGSMYTTAPTQSAAGTEVTGGSPAFVRKTITWGTASGGVITGTATFDIPAGATVVGSGLHTASTGGTYGWGATVTSQAFATQGTYAATFTITIA